VVIELFAPIRPEPWFIINFRISFANEAVHVNKIHHDTNTENANFRRNSSPSRKLLLRICAKTEQP